MRHTFGVLEEHDVEAGVNVAVAADIASMRAF